ncbi:hypothetical protein Dimus_035877, partial [Dionaea muscipula]
ITLRPSPIQNGESTAQVRPTRIRESIHLQLQRNGSSSSAMKAMTERARRKTGGRQWLPGMELSPSHRA